MGSVLWFSWAIWIVCPSESALVFCRWSSVTRQQSPHMSNHHGSPANKANNNWMYPPIHSTKGHIPTDYFNCVFILMCTAKHVCSDGICNPGNHGQGIIIVIATAKQAHFHFLHWDNLFCMCVHDKIGTHSYISIFFVHYVWRVSPT